MEDATEKTIRYLRDVHAAEAGTENIFAGHAEDQKLSPALRSLAQQALQQTRDQKQQIENRIHELGGGGESAFKDFINNALAKGSDLLNIGHDDEDKLTQDIIKAYAAVYLHVGAYESLRAYTQTIGDHTTSQFAIKMRKVDEAMGPMLLKAIGSAAPESADNTTERNTTDGSPATGVNRDLDYTSGAGTSSSSTTYSGTSTGGGSTSNPSEYRDPATDPALRITDTQVPGAMPNYDATNPSSTPDNPASGSRML